MKKLTTCLVCYKQYKYITGNHLKTHGLNAKTYKDQFPGAVLLSDDFKSLGDKNPMKSPEVRKKHKQAVTSEKYKENHRQINKKRYSKLSKAERSKIYGSPGDKNPSKKPENRAKISEGVKQSYINNPELRNIRSKTFGFIGKQNFKKIREQRFESGEWVRPEDKQGYKGYVEVVRKLTQENYTKHFYDIDNAAARNKDWHLDHKVSINYGFRNNIPPEVIAHYKNLEIINGRLNESKGSKCSISIEQLYNLININ